MGLICNLELGTLCLMVMVSTLHSACIQWLTDDVYTNILENELPALLQDIYLPTHAIRCTTNMMGYPAL